MGRTKSVHIGGRMVWTADNAHDIVVAHMAEVGSEIGTISEPELQNWRVWASITTLGFDDGVADAATVVEVLDEVRRRCLKAGDVVPSDLQRWSVLDGELVSGGFLRYEVLPVECLIDVVDGFTEMFESRLAPDPEVGWWFLGVPGGRRVMPRKEHRRRETTSPRPEPG